MASEPATPLAALRRLAASPLDARADEDLLRRFAAYRDEAAFAALVRRHGGLVLDVCRTVLRNEADAEDAFQATFLALAAGARRVRRPGALAGWLHAVAWRTAAKARRARDRRRARDARAPVRTAEPAPDPSWAEVRHAIHEEVNRLPDRCRAAVVLYYLAGRTQDEVARALGLSTAGAKKRLERGRDLLRSALDRRGFGPAAALAAAAVALPAAPAALAESTATLGVRFVANPGAVPAALLSLVSDGVRPMAVKIVFGATVLVGVATTVGLGVLRGGAQDRPGDAPVVAGAQPPGGPPRGFKGDEPPRTFAPAGRGAAELERFRALDPTERLKLIEKLAGKADPFAAAQRNDLVSAILERGSLEPASAFDLVCKVKARDRNSPATTIKWLIDEGSLVKKGDRVAELDDSRLREQLQVAIVQAKAAEAVKVAAVEQARLALHENEIEMKLAEIDVRLATIELKDPPKGQSKEVLELKVEQAKLKLDRARARTRAQQAQAEADLRAKAAVAELETQRLAEAEAQLKECVVLAPADGLVMYPASGGGRFGAAALAQGEAVREGQKLLRVAELKEMVLATRVHEAQISTVRIGQATQVRIDAFPGRALRGKVTQVSPVASMPDWQRSDVKVYPVTVAIEEPPPGLKPGMSGEVQIATGERKAVVQVPLQAVLTVGGDRVCFVKSGQEVIERKVTTGASNERSVEIRDGLKEGELVLSDPAGLLGRP